MRRVGTVGGMASLRPPGSVVSRHVEDGIDTTLVEHIISYATSHLGSAVQVLNRIGWVERLDAENWSIRALVVTGSYAAVVEYRAGIPDRDPQDVVSKSIMVFPLAEVRSFNDPAIGLPSVSLGSTPEPVLLPKGSKASDLFTVR
jgi:hypothetical protein